MPIPTDNIASITAIRISKDGQEEEYMLEAFRRDFKFNGPSLLRLIRVLLNGWQMHKDHPRRVTGAFRTGGLSFALDLCRRRLGHEEAGRRACTPIP